MLGKIAKFSFKKSSFKYFWEFFLIFLFLILSGDLILFLMLLVANLTNLIQNDAKNLKKKMRESLVHGLYLRVFYLARRFSKIFGSFCPGQK